MPPPTRRVVFLGTFDPEKVPRTRVMMETAHRAGDEVIECRSNVWAGMDLFKMRGAQYLLVIVRLALAYPALIAKYLCLPKHDLVVIPYPGFIDVVILFVFVRARHARLFWDVFFSVYDTKVYDRATLAKSSLLARFLYAMEWTAAHVVDCCLLDTQAHGAYVADLLRIPRDRTRSFPVGVTEEFLATVADAPCLPQQHSGKTENTRIIWIGTYIPLHGVGCILEAARMLEDWGVPFELVLFGDGQERADAEAFVRSRALKAVRFHERVPMGRVVSEVRKADIVLGVFGTSRKALSVIPYKVYHALAIGACIVTADTSAMRELTEGKPIPGLHLTPPGDAKALADKIKHLISDDDALKGKACFRLGPEELEPSWRELAH